MKSIVVLSTYFVSNSSANGVCAKNIVKALIEKGNRVHVICYKNEVIDDDVRNCGCIIHMINEKHQTQNNCKISYYVSEVLSCIKPRIDKTLVRNYYETIQKILFEEKIDYIVGMYFPQESISACRLVKKLDENIKCIDYELDSFGNGISSTGLLSSLKVTANNRWLNRAYSSFNKIIVMESHKKYWLRCFGEKYINNVDFADIPALISHQSNYTSAMKKPTYTLLYGGLLDNSYRSPEYLIKCILAIKDSIPIVMKFFTKGNCENMICVAKHKYDGIEQHGYVAEEVLLNEIVQCDFLVSIGNKGSRSVPSKIITYMSFGKPIIHFSTSREDVCAEYLSKYSLALIINECDSFEENVRLITTFIKSNAGSRVGYEVVKEQFVSNTPSFSAHLILSS